jgi:GntR family histidine utilization transcriptional repressor
LKAAEINSWPAVHAEVMRRINSREWKPGEMIPGEEDLAREFGCARATVNRALRELAETGLLERRRKAGTRVAIHPVRKAKLNIPIVRNEIEARGQSYRYALLEARRIKPPPEARMRMQVDSALKLLHISAVHMADGRPYCFEDRWINPAVVPELDDADFKTQSANEWLVENVPFEGGDIAFSATNAGEREAEILSCRPGDGLFVTERTTWKSTGTITYVRLIFAPGYRMHTEL